MSEKRKLIENVMIDKKNGMGQRDLLEKYKGFDKKYPTLWEMILNGEVYKKPQIMNYMLLMMDNMNNGIIDNKKADKLVGTALFKEYVPENLQK